MSHNHCLSKIKVGDKLRVRWNELFGDRHSLGVFVADVVEVSGYGVVIIGSNDGNLFGSPIDFHPLSTHKNYAVLNAAYSTLTLHGIIKS